MCEDLHAADEDSIELLRYLIENLKGPIVIVCLARPEFPRAPTKAGAKSVVRATS